MKLLVQDFLIAAALAFSVTHLSAQTHNILHSFGSFPRDGSAPLTDLVLGSNTLYGTTASGGTNYNGTIFKINTDGSGYGVIQNLTDSPSPEGGMVLISNTLYGTTFTGGSANGGSVFKINTDASDFAVVKTFSATYVGSNYVSGNILTGSGANDDGAKPTVGLVWMAALSMARPIMAAPRLESFLPCKPTGAATKFLNIFRASLALEQTATAPHRLPD